MAKIEFSELNLSRTLIKTKEKRNLKGKQNCIYLLCFAMQNDWFLPHILIILVYLQYWPLCKFEIRAVFKKIRNRLTAELPIVKLYRDDHFSWISNFFFTFVQWWTNWDLREHSFELPSEFPITSVFANKISNCKYFLFLMNLVLFWADKQDWKKNPAGEKMIKLLILIYWNQPTWSFTGSYKLFRALLVTK